MEGSRGMATGNDFQEQLFAFEFAGHWAIILMKAFQMQLDILP